MKELCEVSWTDDSGKEEKTVKEKYYLLHFGLKFTIIEGVGVSYTVAVCENVATGQLEMFDPTQIRMLGTQVKK